MDEEFEREIGLIDEKQYNILQNTLIVLIGLGGVGSYTFEMLIRTGIKNFIIVDKDRFEVSNINRQLEANINTINQDKVNVYFNRGKKINRNAEIIPICDNLNEKNIFSIFENINRFKSIDKIYIIDCIDDINAKIEIIKYCNAQNLHLISSMGTANHLSTENIKISDIKNTKYCPIAKKIRKALKELNIDTLECLYIEEEPIDVSVINANTHTATISYVPATCGIKLAEYVIKKIIAEYVIKKIIVK